MGTRAGCLSVYSCTLCRLLVSSWEGVALTQAAGPARPGLGGSDHIPPRALLWELLIRRRRACVPRSVWRSQQRLWSLVNRVARLFLNPEARTVSWELGFEKLPLLKPVLFCVG